MIVVLLMLLVSMRNVLVLLALLGLLLFLFLALISLENSSVHIFGTGEVGRLQGAVLVGSSGTDGTEHRSEPEHSMLLLIITRDSSPGGDHGRAEGSGRVDGTAVDWDEEEVSDHDSHGDWVDTERSATLGWDVDSGEDVEDQEGSGESFSDEDGKAVEETWVPGVSAKSSGGWPVRSKDSPEEQGTKDRTKHLRKSITEATDERGTISNKKTKGDGRVDVTTGKRTKNLGKGENTKTE